MKQKFSVAYIRLFPKKSISVKVKLDYRDYRDCKKSLQKVFVRKILTKCTLEKQKIYRRYNSLFESIKKKCKKLYYAEKLLKLQGNTK